MPKRTSQYHREHGLRGRSGFTLMELLVVIVILGILATIGFKLIDIREKAYFAVMEADLHNLAAVQAPYSANNYTFANSTTDLQFATSEGITLELVGEQRGFSARTTHVGLPSTRCAIFIGTVSSVYAPATVEGRIACDGLPAKWGAWGSGKGKDGDSCGVGVPSSKAKAQGEAC